MDKHKLGRSTMLVTAYNFTISVNKYVTNAEPANNKLCRTVAYSDIACYTRTPK